MQKQPLRVWLYARTADALSLIHIWSIALIVSIIVLSVMVAQYDVLALVVLIIMVIVQNVFTKRGTSEGVEPVSYTHL